MFVRDLPLAVRRKEKSSAWHSRYLPAFVLLAACALRVLLALKNRGANDNHLEVVKLFLFGYPTNRYPGTLNVCIECYHPKLYHYCTGLIFYYAEVLDPVLQTIIAQLLNVLAGTLTLFIILKFLREHPPHFTAWKLPLFTAIAFNPSLIRINVQVSNDTFVIFFCVLATWLFCRYWRSGNYYHLAGSALALGLGLCSKGNALVVLTWMVATLLIRLAFSVRNGARFKREIAALLLAAFLLAPFFMFLEKPFFPYRDYLRNFVHGSGFSTVDFEARKARKALRVPTDRYVRPGFVSVPESFLSFRLPDLVRHPYITVWPHPFPPHRISLWSQLYGRFHFGHFDRVLWSRLDRTVLILGSTVMIAALVPTIVLGIGLLVVLYRLVVSVCSGEAGKAFGREAWIHALQALAFTAMILIYSYEHQSFTAMKDIYLFPGLLAFIYVYAVGLRQALTVLAPYRFWRTAFVFNCALLIALYLIEHVLVLQELYL